MGHLPHDGHPDPSVPLHGTPDQLYQRRLLLFVFLCPVWLLEAACDLLKGVNISQLTLRCTKQYCSRFLGLFRGDNSIDKSSIPSITLTWPNNVEWMYSHVTDWDTSKNECMIVKTIGGLLIILGIAFYLRGITPVVFVTVLNLPSLSSLSPLSISSVGGIGQTNSLVSGVQNSRISWKRYFFRSELRPGGVNSTGNPSAIVLKMVKVSESSSWAYLFTTTVPKITVQSQSMWTNHNQWY